MFWYKKAVYRRLKYHNILTKIGSVRRSGQSIERSNGRMRPSSAKSHSDWLWTPSSRIRAAVGEVVAPKRTVSAQPVQVGPVAKHRRRLDRGSRLTDRWAPTFYSPILFRAPSRSRCCLVGVLGASSYPSSGYGQTRRSKSGANDGDRLGFLGGRACRSVPRDERRRVDSREDRSAWMNRLNWFSVVERTDISVNTISSLSLH